MSDKIGSFNRYRIDAILLSIKATCEEINSKNRNARVIDIINSINDNNVYINLNCEGYKKFIKIRDLNIDEDILNREVANIYSKSLYHVDDSCDLVIVLTYKYPKAENINGKYYVKKPKVINAYEASDIIEIKTKEGIMKANVGDYIIRGTKGEYYPCKPDIFHDVYRPLTKLETWFYTKILRRK